MALSNLRNEPRREITEQVVGVALFALFIAADYGIVAALGAKKTDEWAVGMFLVAMGLIGGSGILFLLTIAIHGLGDLACNGLAKFGFDPRPAQRYRR